MALKRNSLKRLIISIVYLSFLFGCASPNANFKDGIPSVTYLEQDRWDSDWVNIKSQYGHTEGYIKPDRWDSKRLNVYDKSGKSTGTYLEQDRWQPERWDIKKSP